MDTNAFHALHRAYQWLLLLAAALLLGLPAAADQKPRLTIYTASQKEQVERTAEALKRLVPEAEIVFVRASAGVLTERVLAERAAPQADMILGLAASSMVLFKREGLLEAYRPAGVEALRSSFLDREEPYSFTGMDVYFSVVCLNAAQAQAERLPTPRLWRDLLDPRLKGRIVVAHPGASGTGYGLVAGWLQSMGWEAGWAFMDALDQNVDAYYPTGSGPCLDVARGEHLVGLGLDMRAATERANGAPIESIVPLDRTGWDIEAFGILKGTPHPAIARRIADWAASREANAIYARSYSIVAHPEVAIPEANAMSFAEARMAKASLPWMADNRARILAEWHRRYGGKALHPHR